MEKLYNFDSMNDAAQESINRKSAYYEEKKPQSFQKDNIEHAKLLQSARKRSYYSGDSLLKSFEKVLAKYQEKVAQNQAEWAARHEQYQTC